MRVEAFHYELPADLIAQHPAPERDGARLMVVPAGTAEIAHRSISELPELVKSGSVVVVNDTRVIPARLLCRKRSGAKVEWLLVHRIGAREIETDPRRPGTGEFWRAIGKGVGRAEPGEIFEVASRDDPRASALRVTFLGRSSDAGLLEILLWAPSGAPIPTLLEACGHVPLPPYIKRTDAVEDAVRYQTVYASKPGAIAAPTAGLHLTRSILDRLMAKGCEVATVTLHVGLGTFQPVQSADLDEHPMHAERFVLPEETVTAIARARARGAPVLAVGTTSVRVLESASDPDREGLVRSMAGETRLLIQPGHRWRVVDTLLTNFHQPRSTLMALVCAFAGTERLMAAYRAAVRERYRFFSYGDATLLSRNP
jgi:S-adenosylmethionine:tRNA ribosyltransferase-isomerase